jgi:hypothetical protein
MKTRLAVFAIVLALLLTGSLALAQSGGLAASVIPSGTASGGNYQLTALAWQVSGSTSGEGYQIISPAAPASSENGCCCAYLPCVVRDP